MYYRHLSNADTWLYPFDVRMKVPFYCDTDTFNADTRLYPAFSVHTVRWSECTTDTSVMRTHGSITLMSVWRCHFIVIQTPVMQTFRSASLVSMIMMFDYNTATSVTQTLGTVPMVSLETLFRQKLGWVIWGYVHRKPHEFSTGRKIWPAHFNRHT